MSNGLLQPPNQGNNNSNRHIIFMVVAFIGLFAWTYFSSTQAPKAIPQATPVTVIEKATPLSPVTTPVQTTERPVETKSLEKLPFIYFKTKEIDWEIDPNSGAISSATLNTFPYSKTDTSPVKIFTQGAALNPQFANYTLATVLAKVLEPNKSCQITRTYTSDKHSFSLIENIEVYSPFALKCRFALKTLSGTTPLLPHLTLQTGAMPSQLALTKEKSFSENYNVTTLSTTRDETLWSHDAKDKDLTLLEVSSPIVGTQNKYIISLLFAKETPFNLVLPQRLKVENNNDSTLLWANATWLADRADQFERELVLYAGPKEFDQMRKVDEHLTDAVRLSYFSWFEEISRWFLVALNFINGFCHNYGISIIVLTLIVKAIFWPLQSKATRSMKKMQEVQPLMKEINEKYKDNPQVKQQKIMELYKKEGINPVGGCLPMLLQLPIFIALYASLNGIEMRGVSFLWIHDLSKPDTVGTLFGLGIHPLIIAQTILMVIQQKLSGTGDATQQKMMMIMPLVILFMFYDMPAGLTLYMAVSMLPQIIQELYNKYNNNKNKQLSIKV